MRKKLACLKVFMFLFFDKALKKLYQSQFLMCLTKPLLPTFQPSMPQICVNVAGV